MKRSNFDLYPKGHGINKREKLPGTCHTIGILLCPTKNNIIAEYTLSDMSKPMGISEYKLSGRIPYKLKEELPGIKELKHELEERMKHKNKS